MKSTITFVSISLLALSCTSPELPEPGGPPAALSDAFFQEVVDELRGRSGAPGALLGVSHAGEHRLFASGHRNPDGIVPLRVADVFRAGSITKLMTGSLLLRRVEQGQLSLHDKLGDYVPSFPGAADITLDALLSHTAGVTTRWFFDPDLQPLLLTHPLREWTTDEVIARMAKEPPAGNAGESMRYSNTGFVLLAKVLEASAGASFAQQLDQEVLRPLGLDDSSYPYAEDGRGIDGTFELAGIPLLTSNLPSAALLSAVGASGALHSTVDDLLRFSDALFRDHKLLTKTSLEHMMQSPIAGSDYGHAMMRFCPCSDSGSETKYAGFGHGGHMPGFWSVLVHYPDADLTVVMMINRDSVNGQPIERSIFDPSLQRLLTAHR